MKPGPRSTLAARTTELQLPGRLMERPVPVVLTFLRRSLRRWRGVDLTVAVHYDFGGHDTHTFSMRTWELPCAIFADELQLLYDTRDTTVVASLQDDSRIGSYLALRAHDPRADKLSLMGLFRWSAPTHLSRDEQDALEAGLAASGARREEREVYGPWAWVVGFHGLVIDRDEVPGIIAKLRRAAGDAGAPTSTLPDTAS